MRIKPKKNNFKKHTNQIIFQQLVQPIPQFFVILVRILFLSTHLFLNVILQHTIILSKPIYAFLKFILYVTLNLDFLFLFVLRVTLLRIVFLDEITDCYEDLFFQSGFIRNEFIIRLFYLVPIVIIIQDLGFLNQSQIQFLTSYREQQTIYLTKSPYEKVLTPNLQFLIYITHKALLKKIGLF